jgi:hypothetical protein
MVKGMHEFFEERRKSNAGQAETVAPTPEWQQIPPSPQFGLVIEDLENPSKKEKIHNLVIGGSKKKHNHHFKK